MTLQPSETNPAKACITIHPSPAPAAGTLPGQLLKPRSKTIRALVVEDMEDLAELQRENLAARGFDVEVTYSGTSALALLKSQVFDVALVDIDLPDISGFEMVRRAQAAGYLREARIVFCSGGYLEEREAQARQFAGSGFLAKPFTIESLMATI